MTSLQGYGPAKIRGVLISQEAFSNSLHPFFRSKHLQNIGVLLFRRISNGLRNEAVAMWAL